MSIVTDTVARNTETTGAPKITTDEGVFEADPPEFGTDGANPTQGETVVAKPKDESHKPKEEPVSLKSWAKVSSENRELKAKLAELEAKVNTPGTPNEDAIKAAVLEAIKKPGFGKLLTEAGRPFAEIIEEATGGEESLGVDPKVQEKLDLLQKRLDEKETAEKTAAEERKKQEEERQKADDERAVADSLSRVTKFSELNNETITDPKDPRNGTPRWVMVKGNPDVAKEVVESVNTFWEHNLEKIEKLDPEKKSSLSKRLVEQALDKKEIELRKPLLPKIDSLRPKANTNTDGQKKTVRDTDWRPKTEAEKQPTLTINRAAVAAPPAKVTPKKRFSSGPAKVTFTG